MHMQRRNKTEQKYVHMHEHMHMHEWANEKSETSM